MEKRRLDFDNGTYIDGKKRLVSIVKNGTLICSQNPYSGSFKNVKNNK